MQIIFFISVRTLRNNLDQKMETALFEGGGLHILKHDTAHCWNRYRISNMLFQQYYYYVWPSLYYSSIYAVGLITQRWRLSKFHGCFKTYRSKIVNDRSFITLPLNSEHYCTFLNLFRKHFLAWKISFHSQKW